MLAVVLVGSCPVVSCPSWKCPNWQFSYLSVVLVGNYLFGYCCFCSCPLAVVLEPMDRHRHSIGTCQNVYNPGPPQRIVTDLSTTDDYAT